MLSFINVNTAPQFQGASGALADAQTETRVLQPEAQINTWFTELFHLSAELSAAFVCL